MNDKDNDVFFMRLMKLNNCGVRFNSRCLAYFDNMLVIYNKKLEEITENNFQTKEWKQGIRLSDINKTKLLNKSECFSVSFPKTAIIIYQAYIAEKNIFSKENEVDQSISENVKPQEDQRMSQWQFQVAKNDDAKQCAYSWVEFIKEQQTKQSKKKKKDDNIKYAQSKEVHNDHLNIKQPNNQRMRPDYDGSNRKKQMNEAQMKINQNDEDQKNRKKIECSWEFRMFHMLSGLSDLKSYESVNKKLEEQYTAKIKLNLFFNQFVTICEQKAKEVIEDYCLLKENQKFTDRNVMFRHNKVKGIKKYYMKEEKLYLYIQHGQIGFEENEQDEQDSGEYQEQINISNNHQQQQQQQQQYQNEAYQELDSQQFNHQFKSNKIFFEYILDNYEKNQNNNVKVIQHCLLYINGFKVLGFVETPINQMEAKNKGKIDEEKEEYQKAKNARGIANHMNDNSLVASLQDLSQAMHLKEHLLLQPSNKNTYHNKLLKKKIPLSYLVQLHKWDRPEEWNQFLKNVNSKGTQFKNIDKIFVGLENQTFFYLTRLESIFPIQIEINPTKGNENKSNSFANKLRPELVRNFSKHLNSDAFLQEMTKIESEKDQRQMEKDCLEVVEANIFLKQEEIQRFAEHVDLLIKKPYTNKQLVHMMHSFGINLRFLGLVAEAIHITNMVILIEQEMLARVIKRYINSKLVNIILKGSKEVNQGGGLADESAQFKQQVAHQSGAQKQQLVDMANKEIKNEINKLFNNLYDKSDDQNTLQMWHYFMQQVKIKFSYEIQERKRMDLLTGNFLMNLQETLGVTIKNLKTNLLINSEPLAIQVHEIELYSKTKRFQISQKQVELEIEDNILDDKKEYIKQTRMEIQMAMSQNNKFRMQSLKAKLAELYFLSDDLKSAQSECEKALLETNDHHIDQYPFRLINLKVFLQQNMFERLEEEFESLLSLIRFNFGEFHPYYSDVYEILSKFYLDKEMPDQANRLLQSSIYNCQRCFGATHMRTAITYDKLADLAMYNLEHNQQENKTVSYMNDLYEYLDHAFFTINDRFKVTYPKEYLSVGIKFIKVLQDKVKYQDAFDATIQCLDFIDIIKIRINNDHPPPSTYYKSTNMFKYEVEFLSLQLKNAHGLQKIDLKLVLIDNLFNTDCEDTPDEQELNKKLKFLLFHALHCKFFNMQFQVKYFLKKLVEAIIKDRKRFKKKDTSISTHNIFNDIQSLSKKNHEEGRINQEEKESLNLYINQIIDAFVNNISYLLSMNILSNFFQVLQKIQIDDPKNQIVNSLQQFIEIYLFIENEEEENQSRKSKDKEVPTILKAFENFT